MEPCYIVIFFLQLQIITQRHFFYSLKTKHFKLQYCTLFHQYCTKCAILHTKIGPACQFGAFFTKCKMLLHIRSNIDRRLQDKFPFQNRKISVINNLKCNIFYRQLLPHTRILVANNILFSTTISLETLSDFCCNRIGSS